MSPMRSGRDPGNMTTMTPSPTRSGVAGPTRFRFFAALVSRRTWSEFGYLWLALLVAPFAVAYFIGFLVLTASLIWTVIGLYAGGIVLLGSRGWGSMYRGMASQMLGVDVPAPARFVWPKGFWRKLGALFVDGDAWRALLFMLVSFPLALAASYISTAVLVIALGSITYPIWRPFVPAQQATDGSWHRGSMLGTDFFIDTPARIMMQVLVGIGLLLVWPWIVHGFALLYRVLTRALLGPTRTGQRVAALRATRAAAITDADARLRGIERDLHDGPQARLVAVAMQLGEARVHLAAGTDLDQAAALVDTAHASTKRLSPNCVKSSAAFTLLHLMPASLWRSKPSRPARHCPLPWRSIPHSRPTIFSTLRCSPSRTTASQNFSPTSPSTRRQQRHASRASWKPRTFCACAWRTTAMVAR